MDQGVKTTGLSLLEYAGRIGKDMEVVVFVYTLP